MSTAKPSAIRLLTAFPVPPNRYSSLSSSNTGIGHSGAILEHVPYIYLSIMISPTTRTRLEKSAKDKIVVSKFAMFPVLEFLSSLTSEIGNVSLDVIFGLSFSESFA